MRKPLTEAELARLEAAVREAETGTTAEIVVVVSEGAGHGAATLLWPALLALASPLPLLLAFPRLTAGRLYEVELAVFALALLAGVLLQGRLLPEAARRERTRALAHDEFFARGLHRTARRTGVLLLVATGDRCAEIVADAGVEGPLPDEHWRPCLDGLLAEAARGRLAQGIATALERMGEALRHHLPAGGDDPNEIPDRIVVR